MMFTIVYILYTENLDGPTAGTRVKDEDGTIFSLPCIAGEGNIIRSGESDPSRTCNLELVVTWNL